MGRVEEESVGELRWGFERDGEIDEEDEESGEDG